MDGGQIQNMYNVGFTDFDIVYYQDWLGIPNVTNVLIYAGIENIENITQIQLDRDMNSQDKFFVYSKHTDWLLDKKMSRSAGIVSNTWVDPDTKTARVLLLSNSINSTIWQMYLDAKNPTQVNQAFATNKIQDWDGSRMFVNSKYAIQYATRAKAPFATAIFIWDFKNDTAERSQNPKWIIPLNTDSLIPIKLNSITNLSPNRLFKSLVSNTEASSNDSLKANFIHGIDTNLQFGMIDDDTFWISTNDEVNPYQVVKLGKFTVTLTDKDVKFSQVILNLSRPGYTLSATMDEILQCYDPKVERFTSIYNFMKFVASRL